MDAHEYNYFAECDMILSVEVTRSRDVFILQGFVRHRNQTFDGSMIHRFETTTNADEMIYKNGSTRTRVEVQQFNIRSSSSGS